MITVRPYVATDAPTWNEVVLHSRSGNFLHLRGYMDYHADRFMDRSLIILLAGKPVAVFPASQHDGTIVSHGGLTYGGLISTAALRAEATLSALSVIAAHYRGLRNRKLVYKAVPHIFHRYPAEEDLYALFRLGARLFRRDLSSAIELASAPRYSKGRTWSIGKARRANVTVGPGGGFAAFHSLLSERAAQSGRPVTHSVAELELLARRFPAEIALYEARSDAALLAGALIYDFGTVVHTQYLGASEAGRALGALDLLLAELIGKTYADRRYFSFGISTEQDGQFLNTGLVANKEGFGARAVTHDFYELALT
jgi:hypothetical protein